MSIAETTDPDADIGCTFGLPHWSSRDCLKNQQINISTLSSPILQISQHYEIKVLTVLAHCHTETPNGSNQPQNKFSCCDFTIFFNELSAYPHHIRFR